MRPKKRATVLQATHRNRVLELFIILLWIFLLKLQRFTTLCKMWNAIHMQFIAETDRCAVIWPSPKWLLSHKAPKRKKSPKVSYHIPSTIRLLNLLTLFSFFTIIKLERKIQLENCAFSVPLSSCNKYEKYTCNGQMASRQNTHSKWRTVFHTTQTKSKQQNCCKQKQNNISHQHSRQKIYRKRSWEENQNEITAQTSTLGGAIPGDKQHLLEHWNV